ncbi:VanZ family protein [Flavobacterium sp. RSB2_4_14]|uniref:VanZ family protein n=1 Tax=Flavobacterium sp. RSB2_4_14 TaxID=3447665 RepID=UPI003F2C9484
MLKKTIFGLALSWTILVAFLCLVSFSKLPSFGISGTDKYVHVTFHFVFTLLWGYYSWLNQNKIELKKIVTIVFISFCFGILIEFLQEEFTLTRHADVFDVLANLLGAIIAFLVFVFIKQNKSRNKPLQN